MLKGNSGAKFTLFFDRIRKTRPHGCSLIKWDMAIKKHEAMAAALGGRFKAPAILESSCDHVEMEYVGGKDLFQLDAAGRRDALSAIESYLDFAHAFPGQEDADIESCVVVKINELHGRVDPEILYHFYEREWGGPIKSGFCHGDLSFSNIKMDRGVLWMFDFSVDFMDSPFSDLIKLYMDARYGWTQFQNEVADPSFKVFSSYVQERLEARARAWGMPTPDLRWFAALWALRTIPYSDQEKRDYIYAAVREEVAWLSS